MLPSPHPGNDWEYWLFNPAMEVKLEPESEKGVYELILLVKPATASLFFS
jgi:hypothetical protein